MSGSSGRTTVYVKPEMVELMTHYLVRRESDVEVLRKLMDCGDFDGIQTIGHKLSGNGSMFGIDQISAIGKDLEAAAIERDMLHVRERAGIFFKFMAELEVRPQGTK